MRRPRRTGWRKSRFPRKWKSLVFWLLRNEKHKWKTNEILSIDRMQCEWAGKWMNERETHETTWERRTALYNRVDIYIYFRSFNKFIDVMYRLVTGDSASNVNKNNGRYLLLVISPYNHTNYMPDLGGWRQIDVSSVAKATSTAHIAVV